MRASAGCVGASCTHREPRVHTACRRSSTCIAPLSPPLSAGCALFLRIEQKFSSLFALLFIPRRHFPDASTPRDTAKSGRDNVGRNAGCRTRRHAPLPWLLEPGWSAAGRGQSRLVGRSRDYTCAHLYHIHIFMCLGSANGKARLLLPPLRSTGSPPRASARLS